MVMKKSLTVYRIALVMFAVVILILAVLSVLPFAQEDVTVELDRRGFVWGVEEEELTVEVDIWVNNSGNFDLKDIELELSFEVLDEFRLTAVEEIARIKVGEDRRVRLRSVKNVSEISNELIDHLIYNNTDLDISARFKGSYTFALLSFDALYRDTFLLERVIDEIDYDADNADLFSDTSEEQRFVMPVYLSTNDNDLISGDASISTAIYDEEESKTYSEDAFTHRLGRKETVELEFEVSDTDARELATTSQPLVLRTTISLEGYDFSVHRDDTFDWRAPLNDLEIKNITYRPENETVTGQISFHNDDYRRVDLTLTTTLYNHYGDIIGDFQEVYGVEPDENFDRSFVIELNGEEPAECEVKIELERTGYEYREVYEL